MISLAQFPVTCLALVLALALSVDSRAVKPAVPAANALAPSTQNLQEFLASRHYVQVPLYPT